ncbi:carbonic anhydrase family protein [Polynucleobacter sp. MWH-S4W17]|uniref:carbonic anhydrase family protein n=1 Tax=Polynucleobacter sp. MWH-S4W17 TaxID=1855910 RepID=UPI001BFDF1AE|nr:carbonic anhydrase family protein [Polynucleobacter sp. MWH-S4W17]
MKNPFIILAAAALISSSAVLASDDSPAVTKVTLYKPGITMTKSVQAGISPDDAMNILKAGNERFVSGKPLSRNQKTLVTQTALGQYPLAHVIACMDSRSGPEVVFDMSTGDIFSNRVAGNVINDDILGGLEYGSKVVGTPLIVVLGHTSCGAIKGACDGVKLGNLTQLLEKIQPAVQMSKTPGERNGKNYKFVNEVTELNIDDSVNEIRTKSPILADLEKQGKVKIVGALYDTSTGRVSWR